MADITKFIDFRGLEKRWIYADVLNENFNLFIFLHNCIDELTCYIHLFLILSWFYLFP